MCTSRWLNPFNLTYKTMGVWHDLQKSYKFLYWFFSWQFQVQGKIVHTPLMAFETSTTKNLFSKCCYLYISIILVILEVVFQFFLRLLSMVQYSKPWAIAYMRVTNIYINLKLLYTCNGFPFVQMLGVCFMF